VMTPRTQMVAIPVEAGLEEAADRVAAAARSRYPVYRGSLDDIAGVVHAKDVLAALRSAAPPADLAPLLRPAHFVPGTREVEDVLADMKLLKTHLAIVLDEFGGTAGLVTMEDLLEEIVGQIEDEHDRSAGPGIAVPDDSPACQGSEDLDDINRRLGLSLVSTDYTTLGGYIFGALGRLPKPGDRLTVEGGAFEVLAMDGRRVGAVRFARLKA
jgi:putative hemolysin